MHSGEYPTRTSARRRRRTFAKPVYINVHVASVRYFPSGRWRESREARRLNVRAYNNGVTRNIVFNTFFRARLNARVFLRSSSAVHTRPTVYKRNTAQKSRALSIWTYGLENVFSLLAQSPARHDVVHTRLYAYYTMIISCRCTHTSSTCDDRRIGVFTVTHAAVAKRDSVNRPRD